MPSLPVLSICMPVYNESSTLPEILDRVLSLALPVPFEVVVVDDGSSDGTDALLRERAQSPGEGMVSLFHGENRGKAAALSTAFQVARGSILCIQDADLEYDPRDLPRLIAPVLTGRADAVFGSRYLPGSHREGGTLLQALANRFLTLLSNAFTGLRLTDMETCYKVFRRGALGRAPLRSTRFGVEPELTARIAAWGGRVLELPIRYRARRPEAGKKIGWRDGLAAVGWIVRFGLFGPPGAGGNACSGSPLLDTERLPR
ncbi:MAG: glycosyltransferase family 2 protein [Planctomycetota bacterium]|jgi:glycosyltransferase involved in cell wall biosynthesis